MNCPECGYELKIDSGYAICPNCGRCKRLERKPGKVTPCEACDLKGRCGIEREDETKPCPYFKLWYRRKYER